MERKVQIFWRFFFEISSLSFLKKQVELTLVITSCLLGSWTTKVLSEKHTHENLDEVARLAREHPNEESTVIIAERLLGQLYPLRAFGDCQYKWPVEKLKKILRHHQLMHMMPGNYTTPPYLTAEPAVSVRTRTYICF